MGSGTGEPSDGEPDPIDVELVLELDDEDGDLLAGSGPNSAAADSETIAGVRGGRSRLPQLPRALRLAAALAAALVLAAMAWPTGGARQTMPQPTPTPSQIDADLFKVRLGQTTLQQSDGSDHATLGLELTNEATSRLTVVSAELWDAVGTRIGSAAVWPAEALDAQSTSLVPVTMPYACDAFQFLPVLPITIRYSISTPENSSVRRDYAFPLTDLLWEAFTHQRETRCAGAGDEISAVAIDTTQPIGAPSDAQGFDLTFAIEAAGTATWTLEKATSADQDVTVTTSALPVTVRPGRTTRVSTHWHIDDCARRPVWTDDIGAAEFKARMNGPSGDGGSSERVFMAELRPGLVREIVQAACGD